MSYYYVIDVSSIIVEATLGSLPSRYSSLYPSPLLLLGG